MKQAALSLLFSMIAAGVGMLSIFTVAYMHAVNGLVLPWWVYGLVLLLSYAGTLQLLYFAHIRLFPGGDE